jgi:hypothetical protein
MNGRHFGARLHDYTLQGYRTIALENELLRVEVLADKGTDIVAFVHKPSDTDFMWRREVGLQPAGLGAEPRGADEFVFVDQYEGGWQECLPNGGASVRYKGAQLPFHGELLTRPFAVDVIEDRPEVVSVRLSVRTLRMPLVLEKTLTLRSGRAVLEIDERLTNLADEELDIMWGHHPAFGPPFLDDSCRIDVPANGPNPGQTACSPGRSRSSGRGPRWSVAARGTLASSSTPRPARPIGSDCTGSRRAGTASRAAVAMSASGCAGTPRSSSISGTGTSSAGCRAIRGGV